MYLINTTYGWNLGDDLIREGVINLLGIQNKSKVFVNRCQLRAGSGFTPMWKSQRNMCSPRELVEHASGLVVAGSPEWVRFFEEFYEVAIEHNLPIYLVGVGMRCVAKRDLILLDRVKHLVCGATVRDRHAAVTLKEVGIPCKWFPDPAFSADYPIPESKRYGLVVNYRAAGGNGEHEARDDFDYCWREIANSVDQIDLVTVHEQVEYNRACKIFKAPVFYSSDHREYKDIYANAEVYIGGRIHGAVPVVACGGTAHVFYDSTKIDALKKVAEFMDTLTVTKYGRPISKLNKVEAGPSLERLHAHIVKHEAYWRDVI